MAAIPSTRCVLVLAAGLCLLGVASAQFPGQPQPQPQQGFGCSQFDSSPQAIVQCLNVVRRSPQQFRNQAGCQFQGQQQNIFLQPAAPLQVNQILVNSARAHSNNEAQLVQLLPNGFDQRIRAAGFNGRVTGSIVDFTFGNNGARSIVNRWLCNPQNAQTLASCGFQFVGVGVTCPNFQGQNQNLNGGCIFTVDFGGDGRQCFNNQGGNGGFPGGNGGFPGGNGGNQGGNGGFPGAQGGNQGGFNQG